MTLGKDEYFVLGDNRNQSFDSRNYYSAQEIKIYELLLINALRKNPTPTNLRILNFITYIFSAGRIPLIERSKKYGLDAESFQMMFAYFLDGNKDLFFDEKTQEVYRMDFDVLDGFNLSED